ncbi:MAG: DUF1572 family protein [Lewinellaceae bacterium]|jgi:uncharacterized damage-inducible protein DinB|nr:DUF1572 family protein [Lewinellaceae bacterium]
MSTPELQELATQIILRMEENTPRIEKCLAELSETEIWQRPNAASNSIGILILHLCGNITQYVIASLGNNTDMRNRDAEFAAEGGFTKAELLKKLRDTVRQAVGIVRQTNREAFLHVRSVQGFRMSGIGIVVHVCEHYSYHTGQIAFWTKLLKNKDLGFYADLDLNVKNA